MKTLIKKYSFNIIITVICIIVLISTKNEQYIKISKILLILGNINVLAISLWSTAEFYRDYKHKAQNKKNNLNKSE